MRVLVVNCGSSSVKLSLIDARVGYWLARGSVDRVGSEAPGKLRIELPGTAADSVEAQTANHEEALRWLIQRFPTPDAVGHRVVHGGEAHVAPAPVTDALLADLEGVSRLAPLHNPPGIQGIRIARALFPSLPQVAVFDTAFHATLPPHAYRYALPERFYTEFGIRRYGFHGLSHGYVSERAAALLGKPDVRLVSLHLGNGCSATAIQGGRSVDTSMGLTPLEGLVMGTRSGDVDPALPLLLQCEAGMTPAEVERLLNQDSGLEALSGGTGDMRDIEAGVAAGSASAALAFDTFCYRVRKYVGAYAAALGGLDALAFTGGIGENSARVRAAVCDPLAFLGLRLDPLLNRAPGASERTISTADATARTLVIPANEEQVIASAVEATLAGG